MRRLIHERADELRQYGPLETIAIRGPKDGHRDSEYVLNFGQVLLLNMFTRSGQGEDLVACMINILARHCGGTFDDACAEGSRGLHIGAGQPGVRQQSPSRGGNTAGTGGLARPRGFRGAFPGGLEGAKAMMTFVMILVRVAIMALTGRDMRRRRRRPQRYRRRVRHR